MSENISLVRHTKLEELALQYQKEAKKYQENDLSSKLNIERRDGIAREIQDAFCFLADLGKPYSAMTLEEFEFAQEEIKKNARHELDKKREILNTTFFFQFLRKRGLRFDIYSWEFELEHGYGYKIRDNSLEKMLPLVGITKNMGIDWKRQLPSNLGGLVNEIFAIRFRAAAQV